MLDIVNGSERFWARYTTTYRVEGYIRFEEENRRNSCEKLRMLARENDLHVVKIFRKYLVIVSSGRCLCLRG